MFETSWVDDTTEFADKLQSTDMAPCLTDETGMAAYTKQYKGICGMANMAITAVKKKADMIQASDRYKAKEFENFAAIEEYEPTDDESMGEIGF